MPQFKSEFSTRAHSARVPTGALSRGPARLLPIMLLALLGAVPAGAQPAEAAAPAVAPAPLERYLAARSAHFVDWLADGSLLIATRFGETQQIHRLRTPL